jgi:hypothetical protein
MIASVFFLITETIKLLQAHLAQRGVANTLTQAQAEAMVAAMAKALPDVLPTPEELEALGAPPA